MTTARWLAARMLEFNFLPSYTLHPSRFDAFAVPGLGRALQDKPDWWAAWHRHWSRGILRKLDVGPVGPDGHRELALVLLHEDALTQLARRVAIVVCSETLRRTILGEAVRAMEMRLGRELVSLARRDGMRYVHYLPSSGQTVLPGTLEELEKLGMSILLSAVSAADPALLRRFELKLPSDIVEDDSPLHVGHAWPLCIAVMKDMDEIWCSSFPEIL